MNTCKPTLRDGRRRGQCNGKAALLWQEAGLWSTGPTESKTVSKNGNRGGQPTEMVRDVSAMSEKVASCSGIEDEGVSAQG